MKINLPPPNCPLEEIQRLEDQIGQLIRIIANLNERLNIIESTVANPFLLPSKK